MIDLSRLHELAETGREPLQGLHRDVAQPFPFARPIPLSQVAGRGLHDRAHHVPPLGRERRDPTSDGIVASIHGSSAS